MTNLINVTNDSRVIPLRRKTDGLTSLVFKPLGVIEKVSESVLKDEEVTKFIRKGILKKQIVQESFKSSTSSEGVKTESKSGTKKESGKKKEDESN
jgi:hypothetical protein